MILQSGFHDETDFDELALAHSVDQALRDIFSRGASPPLQLTDTKDFPDAMRLAGSYRAEGARVTVDTRLRPPDGKTVSFTVTGEKTNVAELAKKIAAAAVKAMSG